MTYPTPPPMLKGHNHISEREPDGSWEDCTWDSGLEWYRLCYDASKPATHAEAQELRKASGEPSTGGSNVGDLRRGIKARYGRDVAPAISGFTALWAALDPGFAAMSQGGMSAFGPTHRLSRWQPGFDGSHAVFIARVDNTDRVWWCDPLATDPAGPSYNGEFVSKAELKAFVDAFGGQHLVDQLTIQESQVANLVTYLPGYTAKVKAQSNIRSAPAASSTAYHSAIPTAMKVNIVGTVVGSVDPANGSNVWYEFFHDGRSEYTAKDNIIELTPPAPVAADDGFTKATQDAALAAAKVKADAEKAAAVSIAVAAEQARIRGVLGI